MKQAIRKIVQSQAHVVKTVRQAGEDVGKFAASRGFMGGDQLIITASDIFVEINVWRAPQAPALSILVKNSGDKERIISDMSAEQERLFRRRPSEGNQHVGNVLVRVSV